MGDEFAPGVEVEFNGVTGVIKFVCEYHLTVCPRDLEGNISDVCIVAYNYQWDQIKLLRSNR